MTKMSDCEEDSGVHTQLEDERIDSPVDKEGIHGAPIRRSLLEILVILNYNTILQYNTIQYNTI